MKIYFAAFMAFLTIMCSCDNSPRLIQEVKKLNGKIVEFPKYEILAFDSILTQDSCYNTNDIKLVSYIDNVPCTPCILNMLQNHVNEVNKELGEGFPYMIVLQTDDRQKLINTIREYNFRIPIMYYRDSRFADVNKLYVLARNKTFLLNRDNKIVVVGEPFANKQLWNVYKKAINQLKHGNL